MPHPDSHDALADSIERRVRADLSLRDSSAALGASIDRALLDEARAGELRVAWLRLVVVGAHLVLLLLALTGSPRTLEAVRWSGPLLLGAVWVLAGAAIAIALRRGWYRRWLRTAGPLLDGAMIGGSFALVVAGGSAAWRLGTAGVLAYLTALCGFLIVTGALRLSRTASRVSTILALGVFAAAAIAANIAPALGLAIGATLLVTGIVAGRLTRLIRRIVLEQTERFALTGLYEEAQHAVDAREQVLKIVSHDLRNPLHTISMTASLLLEGQGSDEQRQRQLMIIRRAGERMNRMIQDLLDVAKLEAGRLAIATREVEVRTLLEEAGEMLRPLAAERSLALETRIGPDVRTVEADPGRVLQALSNLVGNAIKFTSPGGRITIRADRAQAGGVQCAVADTGGGIPPEQLPKIFGRFWQPDPADRRGIGLGLAITKGIVEAHGGRIWVESRVGEGTTFYFTVGRR